MITVHEAFLAAWDDLGTVPPLDALRGAGDLESGGEDLGRWLEEVGLNAAARPVAEFEPVYREHVASDLALLQAIESDLDALHYLPDPKLQLLAAILRENPGKTCVFASYSETVRYLDAGLDAALGSSRDRVVIIGGDTTPDQRTRMLARLCPDTVVEPGYRPPDGEVDLLISTDVVSEGQNLQQAQAVISYDMPWNPQRVVQRNGRVLRLRSPHETVWLTTMLPVPGELEPLLRLEARIQAKIVASGVYGMEVGVLGDEAQTEARIYEGMDGFTDRLESGDTTLLSEAEDAGGSFAGEQLRAVLIRAAAEGEVKRLLALPWGIGATFRQGPGVPSTGPAGVFFACRTSDASGGARYWRFVDDQGVSSDELPIIRRINPGPADGADMPADIEPAWRLAVQSIIEEHNGRANPPPETNRLPPSQRFALELLADPAVALPVGAEDAYELLSAPRDGAVKLALSDVQRQLAARDIGRIDAAREIVGIVREYGLTPVPPPPELQSITQDDVGVVCWMRVLSPERIRPLSDYGTVVGV